MARPQGCRVNRTQGDGGMEEEGWRDGNVESAGLCARPGRRGKPVKPDDSELTQTADRPETQLIG